MSASSSEKKDTSCGAACAVEERCPICLDDFQDKAFITSCFHILLSEAGGTKRLPMMTHMHAVKRVVSKAIN